MPFRYEMTTTSGAESRWRITGPGVNVEGAERGGYLTLPPFEILDTDGEVVGRLGGNRRIAPNRHILTGRDDGVLATFTTHVVGRVVDTRPILVTDDEENELFTLVPGETAVSGVRASLAAAVSGGYFLTRRGERIGHVGNVGAPGERRVRRRLADLARQAVERGRGVPSEHVAGVLESEIELDPLLVAAILLYKRSVLDPSRLPES